MALNPIAQSLVNYLRQKQAVSGGGVDNVDQTTLNRNPQASQAAFQQADAKRALIDRPKPFMTDPVDGSDDDSTDIGLRNLNSNYSPSDLFSSNQDNNSANRDNNQDNYDVGKLLQQKLTQYSQLAGSPAKKQNPWAQAAFVGLQALQHAINPKDNTPIQLLGNAKKARKMADLRESIAPLLQQQQIQQQTQKFNDDAAYRKTQTDALAQQPILKQAEINRKVQGDADRAKYREGLLIEKKLTREQAGDLSRERIRLMDEGLTQNAEKIKQIDRKLDEFERHNKAEEGQKATDEEGRNNRFKIGEQVKANLVSAKMRFELAMKQFQAATGADKTTAQQNVNNARAAYLEALTRVKNGEQ